MTNEKSDRPIMTPFWLALWACTLALGWLLPNHYRPWVSFHSDAWIAAVLLLGAAAVILGPRVGASSAAFVLQNAWPRAVVKGGPAR